MSDRYEEECTNRDIYFLGYWVMLGVLNEHTRDMQIFGTLY